MERGFFVPPPREPSPPEGYLVSFIKFITTGSDLP